MTTTDPSRDVQMVTVDANWWRDRVWTLQHGLALAEARIEGLQNTDGQHRDELLDLRREMSAIRVEIAGVRAETNKNFVDLTARFDLYMGSLREDIAGLKARPAKSHVTGIPSGRAIFLGLIGIGALAAAAFGMGAATHPEELLRSAVGLVVQ